MSSQAGGSIRPLVTVLYIGDGAARPNVEQLRHEGIGVMAVHSAARALQLLKNFRVAAAICDLPDLSSVTRLAATQTPVILLAVQDADWGGPEAVSVVSRRTPSAVLARHVRALAGIDADRSNPHAA